MEKSRVFEGVRCWNPDRINLVINKEAVSVDRANFLATHAPLGRVRYERAARAMHDPGEEGLLQELLTSQVRDEHAFVVVRGIPGTGKSHLIRWLKERYEASQTQRRSGDVVLLIERAQCTLRGSLEQIIRSGVFDNVHMKQQLKRLQDATTELSQKALADNVLAQLQVAAKNELESPTIERPRGQILQNLEDFLLDRTIREYLKRKDGPVDRIMRYLAYGKDAAMSSNEEPGFAASDFDLPETVMHALRQEGYQTTRELARDLHTFPNRRSELATYLNRLLNNAIGRMTALTADDLKSMFSDLRRQLRHQGKGLALFIEDITAFTGIDKGLVDVLATQHTGEANQQFCRMHSVIGVTDNYYNDSFQTNIKERVTLHLSLNAESGDDGRETHEADLLRDEDARADLAGRYLNAMRLSQEELDDWLARGADPQLLPNACARCAFRLPCHAAFGQITPHSGGHVQPIGLYPFNTQALTRLYQGVKGTTHTPRSFLNDVLAYVLHSYGDEVVGGDFPPSPTQLGTRFRVPLLLQPAQTQTIIHQTHSSAEADRIESLLRLWGDRTAYSRNVDGKRMVGGLSEEVFTAFNARFIVGEPIEIDGPGHPQPPLIPAPPITLTPPEPKPVDEFTARLEEDIEEWRRGARLKYYEEFAGRLVAFLRTAIAWDAYDITRDEVLERLQKQRLVFEDQVGQVRAADHILFSRSVEMASVLHSLEYLTERVDPASSAITAGHLARLSTWLHNEEPRIVSFVGQAGGNADEPLSASDILILTAATLEVLAGGLNSCHNTPEALLEAIITRASDPPKLSDMITTTQGVRPEVWVETLRNASPTQESWRRLLFALNRQQGRAAESSDSGSEDSTRRYVYFLDVVPALKMLDVLLKSDWELPPRTRTSGGRLATPAPGSPEKMYDTLRTQFNAVLRDAQQAFVVWKGDLDEFFGQDSHVETLNAVSELLHKFQYAQLAYPNTLDHPPEEIVIDAVHRGVEDIAMARSRAQLALALSGAQQITKQTRLTVNYFKGVAQFLKAKSASLDVQLDGLRGASETRELSERVEREYGDLEGMLTRATGAPMDAAITAMTTEREGRDR